MNTKFLLHIIVFFLLNFLSTLDINAQTKKPFFQASDTLNKARLYTGIGLVSSSYIATSVGLYNTWYKKFDQSKFHFFNDWNEWQNMDKLGHAYTAYNLSNIAYQGARWTGSSKKSSLWFAAVGSTAIQMAIETMDGFSSEWGFSISDVGFNFLGTGLFIAQESIWDQQKIRLKLSSYPINYTDDLVTINGVNFALSERVDELFGKSGLEKFLKDYNAQAIWLSANIHAFFPKSRTPKWLNLAVGYSGQNMFGGFENKISIDEESIIFDDLNFQRHHQFLLALDIDLDRIESKNHFVKSILSFINIFKVPSPAIEYNSLGEWRFHLLFKH